MSCSRLQGSSVWSAPTLEQISVAIRQHVEYIVPIENELQMQHGSSFDMYGNVLLRSMLGTLSDDITAHGSDLPQNHVESVTDGNQIRNTVQDMLVSDLTSILYLYCLYLHLENQNSFNHEGFHWKMLSNHW